MGIGIKNMKEHIELSIPLHDDIDLLAGHLTALADKLKSIKNQKILDGYNGPLTSIHRIEEIGISKYTNYFSLNVLIRKNGDFTLLELEKALEP